MKYVVTEDQYDKLLQASLKRHSNDEPRDIKTGTFNYNGKLIKYSITTRPNGSVYVSFVVNYERHSLYLTNDETFIQMDKKEQENIIQYKIKKFLDKKN